MPKVKSKSAWLKEWINRVNGKTNYTTDGKVIFCQPCQQQVQQASLFFYNHNNDYTQRKHFKVPITKFCHLKQHDETAKHKANVELFNRPSGSTKKQQFLTAQTTKNLDEFSMDLCSALVSANIPFFKLENQGFRGRLNMAHEIFLDFLEKYCKRLAPHKSVMCNYLTLYFEQKMMEIKNKCKQQKVWASVDETTDCRGRYVANLIVGILDGKVNKPLLVAVKFLEKTNHDTIARFVNDSLRELISAEDLWLLVTDGPQNILSKPNPSHLFVPRPSSNLRGNSRQLSKCGQTDCEDQKIFSKAPSRVAKFREVCDLPLPPRPVITRWGTWINAADYYCKNLDQIRAIIGGFNPADSDAIRQSQIALDCPGIRGDLAFIKSNFTNLPGAIENLESRNLTLIESLDIVSDVGNELKFVPGNVGKLIQEKFSNVLRNNPGFERILEIGMVLRGECVQILLPPDVMALFKNAPIQSCEVERSFSAYKNILADNRMSFTPENLEKYLICNCNSEK